MKTMVRKVYYYKTRIIIDWGIVEDDENPVTIFFDQRTDLPCLIVDRRISPFMLDALAECYLTEGAVAVKNFAKELLGKNNDSSDNSKTQIPEVFLKAFRE